MIAKLFGSNEMLKLETRGNFMTEQPTKPSIITRKWVAREDG